MKLSLNWIRDFVDIPAGLTSEGLGEMLTLHTAEVEEVVDMTARYDKMVLGVILEVKKHENANRLNVTQVDIGEKEPVQIVCGGQNLTPGMKIAAALPGAQVDLHGQGLFEIGAVKIRGEASHGMICAGEEIWLEPDNAPGAKEDVKIKDLSHLDVKPGTPLAEALGLDEVIFDIDNKSLTHRPDLWGHYGMAREFAAILQNPLKPLDDVLYSKQGGSDVELNVEITDDEVCPRLSACAITGIEIAPSPQWMQDRLHAAGMNAHNNIVDITNYVMLELGQPMHAYDRSVIGDHFVVGRGKDGVKLVTLDEEEHKLHVDDPVIYNSKGEALTLAGIKGGLDSGIHDHTTEIILEAANWNPILLRKASMRHALRTDASQRFEKGLDPSMTDVALRRAIQLIVELCPSAKVISPLHDFGSWKKEELTVSFSPERARQMIGVDIDDKEMKRILESLDFTVDAKKDAWSVTVPSHRSTGDVSLEEDLVEEVARIHGYDNIEPILPELPIGLPRENTERFHKHALRHILAKELGFSEVLNYSFYGVDLIQASGLDEDAHIRVLNYLSEDQTHMRTSLVPNLLAAAERNQNNFEAMRLFEIGRTYKEVDAFMPLEEKWVAGLVIDPSMDEIFYLAKGACEHTLARFRAGNVQFKPARHVPPYAHPKKCLDIVMRGQAIGSLFAVHPGVQKAMGLENEVGLFEINFTKLAEHGRQLPDFEVPAKFPGMDFDVSVMVDERTEIGDLEKAIRSSDKNKLIQAVTLFDIYQGEHIEAGKKSLSFNIQIQHADRTLTETEFQEVQSAVFLALEKKGGTIRGK